MFINFLKKSGKFFLEYLLLFLFLRYLAIQFDGLNFLLQIKIWKSLPISLIAFSSFLIILLARGNLNFIKEFYPNDNLGGNIVVSLFFYFFSLIFLIPIFGFLVDESKSGDMQGLGTALVWGYILFFNLASFVYTCFYLLYLYLFRKQKRMALVILFAVFIFLSFLNLLLPAVLPQKESFL